MSGSTKINQKSKHLSWIKKSLPFLKGTRISCWNNLMPVPSQQCFSTFFFLHFYLTRNLAIIFISNNSYWTK